MVFAIWSLIALVLAVFAMRRQNWARILTVISAAMTALFSLLAILSVVSVIPLIAAIAAVVLYFTGGANEWYRAQERAAAAARRHHPALGLACLQVRLGQPPGALLDHAAFLAERPADEVAPGAWGRRSS